MSSGGPSDNDRPLGTSVMRAPAQRSLGGALVLAVALLLALMVPRVLAADVPGIARREPDPPPPPVGSCLLWPAYDVVDCSQPHTSEIVRTWAADDPELPGPADDGHCGLAALTYMGMRPAHLDPIWRSMVPLQVNGLIFGYGSSAPMGTLSTVIQRAPERERLDGPGWKICTAALEQIPETTVGSLANLAQNSERPAVFGVCLSKFTQLPDNGEQVPCSEPHETEIFAQAFAMLYDDPSFIPLPNSDPPLTALPSQSTMENQCRQLAKDLMQAGDPGFAGQLTINSQYSVQRTEVGDSGGTVNPGGDLLFADCTITAPAGHLLTESLVGIGTKPLPLQ